MIKQIIVDENDQPIGLKLRDQLDFKKDIYRVSALWLTNSRGQVLIAQRSLQKKNNPGKWGPAVAGTVEEDETYESNIEKECEEEIGLTGVELVLSHKFKMPDDAPRRYFCQYFTATVDRPAESFVLQPEEVDAVKWVEPGGLRTDIDKHPDKYVNGVKRVVGLFL